MTSNRRFEFNDGSSNKFWEISADDSSVTTVWGRIGTDGQSKTKPFPSSIAVQKEYDKLIKEKTSKGYIEIGGSKSASKSKPVTAVKKKASSDTDTRKAVKAAAAAGKSTTSPTTKAATNKTTTKKLPTATAASTKAASKKASAKKSTTTTGKKATTKKVTSKKATVKKVTAKKAIPPVTELKPDQFDEILMKHAREMVEGFSDTSPKKFKHGKWLLEQSPEASLVILRAAFRLASQVKKQFKDDNLWNLRDCLLKRNLPYTLKDIEFICKKVHTAITYHGIDPLLIRPIEYWVSSDPSHVLSDAAKESLSLARNNKKLEKIWIDQSKSFARIDKLLGQSSKQEVLELDCPWAVQVSKDIESMKPAPKENWKQLLAHCVLVGNSPTEKWKKGAAEMVRAIGATSFQSMFQRWTERASEKEVDGQINFVEGTNEHILCGLVRCSIFQPTDRTAAILGAFATNMYRAVPGIGPRSMRVGNACIATLGAINSNDSISQLAIVKSKIKKRSLQNMVARQLDSVVKSRNTSLADLEELTIPSYGLTEVGVRVESCEKLRVKVLVSGPKSVDIHWYDDQNKVLSKLPSKLSDACSAWVASIKQDAKDLEKMLVVQRDRIEGMYCLDRSWSFSNWQERYLNGLLVGILARTLIWTFKEKGGTQTGIWHDGSLVDSRGKKLNISDRAMVSLWHPLDSSPDEIKLWRTWVVDNQIQQCLKQAFREVYLVTDAERKTKSYSNRFAAHILRQAQFRALAQQRGWKPHFFGGFDGGDIGDTTREFPHLNLTANFTGSAILGSQTEGYAYQYMSTDRVRFTSPLGWKGKPQPITDIPRVVFSEVMRDVDLFVGVCSVGNDPNWKDRGAKPDFNRYWESYSVADLVESGKSRHAVLTVLIPRMKRLNSLAKLQDKYLRVQGKLHAYLIHLGSSNIQIESNNQYLCIVPKGTHSTLDVVLPYEGDLTLSLILSKALMLIDDDKISDPLIRTQLA